MDALPQFELLRPRTLDDVIKARADHPGSRMLGGGTDLVVNIRRGIVAPPTLIDVNTWRSCAPSRPTRTGSRSAPRSRWRSSRRIRR
jgi:CO/xanthine dehydrogenase FAD-binding subunit